jgi:hypothetical protein
VNWPLFVLVCLTVFLSGSRYGRAIGQRVGRAFIWLTLPRTRLSHPHVVALDVKAPEPKPRDFTAEELARWDVLMNQIDALDGRLSTIIKVSSGSDVERQLREQRFAVRQEAKVLAESVLV